MDTLGIQHQFVLFARRFGLLNAVCCERCCGEEVSLAQSHILDEIRRNDAPSMQRIATALGMDVTTFSRQIKALEGRGLVTRTPSPQDRRVSILSVTGQGMRVLDGIDRFLHERIERIFSTMTPFERSAVAQSLILLNGAIARIDGTTQDQMLQCATICHPSDSEVSYGNRT